MDFQRNNISIYVIQVKCAGFDQDRFFPPRRLKENFMGKIDTRGMVARKAVIRKKERIIDVAVYHDKETNRT